MIKFNYPELQKIYEISPAFIKTRVELLEKIDNDIRLLEQILRDEKITVYKDYWCNSEDYYIKWMKSPDDNQWYIWCENRKHSSFYKDIRFLDAHPLEKLALYPFLPNLYKRLLAMNDHG